MEAIGTLAGGIATDFNNILAFIIPYCVLCVEEAAGRNCGSTWGSAQGRQPRQKPGPQILTFSHHQQHRKRQVCELEPVVKEALKLLRSALPSTIQMIRKFSPPIRCSRIRRKFNRS